MSARWVPLLLIALLAIVHAQLWLGRGSIPHVAELQHKLAQQKVENAQAQQVNDRLASEVRDLKEGVAAAEDRARSELGMIKPGEVFYRVVEDPAQRLPAPVSNGEDEADADAGEQVGRERSRD